MSRDERRSAIVVATVPLLAELGADVTTRQIAEAAGVAEGTLFKAFDDKTELLHAAALAAMDAAPTCAAVAALPDAPLEELVASVARVLQEGMIERTRVMHAVRSIFAQVLRGEGAAPGTAGAAGPRHGPHVEHVLALLRCTADRLEPHADRLGGNSWTAARVLLNLAVGLGPPGMAGVGLLPPELVAAVVVRGLAHGPAPELHPDDRPLDEVLAGPLRTTTPDGTDLARRPC
ncbi:TetR/AcrR family transcriptional regulator [Cellulomonas marina]|uniref:Regulatory protein, tetR family n=1 Tax=Cellulomonas marina TaxID=988821 RepID=A0A1I0ZR22_9CELL|nr:helix-turn-helix domain-containing protein [Cellulomonas marina]GIG28817.1 hypothetical protein Cma02nite_14170 [Cellulomonas marina]SFB28174.1 regulatory protein, tetR family [Cellulomonas marina]